MQNFLPNCNVAIDPLHGEAERLRGDGATVVFMAIDGKLAGLIAIADPVKATTPAALEALKAQHIRIVMLTGDNATTARAVANKLGIADVEAEILPERKYAAVEALRRAGRVVAMAGDGINDAPALAAADIGIAMGNRHRYRDRKRRHDAGEGRSHRHRPRAKAFRRHHAQYPSESAVRLSL